jgi:hypothetical protein
MRIPASDHVLVTGQRLCPEFDCPKGQLPDKIQVLLCLLDGAEGRRQLQAKLDRVGPVPKQSPLVKS